MVDSVAAVYGEDVAKKEIFKAVAENFLVTRECFFYPQRRAPVLQATFKNPRRLRSVDDELDIEIEFGWNIPKLGFEDLYNVVFEGDKFILKPMVPSYPRLMKPPFANTCAYFVGPDASWLIWDEARECFQGDISSQLASHVGAERLNVFTISLDIKALVTTQFPGNILFDRQINCTLPLSIKRRPDTCDTDKRLAPRPGVTRPTVSRMIRGHEVGDVPLRTSILAMRSRCGLNDLPAAPSVKFSLDHADPAAKENADPVPRPPTGSETRPIWGLTGLVQLPINPAYPGLVACQTGSDTRKSSIPAPFYSIKDHTRGIQSPSRAEKERRSEHNFLRPSPLLEASGKILQPDNLQLDTDESSVRRAADKNRKFWEKPSDAVPGNAVELLPKTCWAERKRMDSVVESAELERADSVMGFGELVDAEFGPDLPDLNSGSAMKWQAQIQMNYEEFLTAKIQAPAPVMDMLGSEMLEGLDDSDGEFLSL